jgi:uncharacterized protein (DUF1330 family)
VAVYLIADIRVINPQRYDEYRAVMRGAVRAHGGRYLVRTDEVRVLEGNWVPPRIVQIEFPDQAAARAFRDGPEFARARDICANAAMVDMVLAEGVDPVPAPLPPHSETYYVISDIKVINPERFAEYRRSSAADVARLGGRYLVRDGQFEIIAGGWQPTRLSIVEYPSRAAIDARLGSDEYERSRALRANAAMVDRIVVEGWPQGKPLE